MIASRSSLAAALDLERIEPWRFRALMGDDLTASFHRDEKGPGHRYSTVALEDPDRIPTFGELAMSGDDSACRRWSRLARCSTAPAGWWPPPCRRA
jgi:hypothetical protein